MDIGTPLAEIVLMLAAYLVGGIPFGWILARLTKGVDLRTVGSGGTGATNCSRLWQGKAVVLTLLLPYVLSHCIVFLTSGGRRPWLCLVAAGIAATGLTTIGGFFAPAVLMTTAVAVGGGLLVSAWKTVTALGGDKKVQSSTTN